jgi:hypothetical protein
MTATARSIVRKAPRTFVTNLGDLVSVVQAYDDTTGQLTEHIVIAHPRDLEHVAFTPRARHRRQDARKGLIPC